MKVFRIVAVIALLTAPAHAQTLIQSFDPEKTPQQKADDELRAKFSKEKDAPKKTPETSPRTSADPWGNVRGGDGAKSSASKSSASKAPASKASGSTNSNPETATSVKPRSKTGTDAD
jgi:hypothetical protein